jgi:hypothetical protein
MIEPVSGSIFDKGYVTDIVLLNMVVQTEENAQAGLGKDCVCWLENDVIAGNIPV